MKGFLKKLLVLALLVVAGGYALWRWDMAAKVRETDNAYVNADRVQVGSVISGKVIAIHVRDGQFVEAGAPLFELDPEPFRVAVNLAEARLAEAMQAQREAQQDVDAAAAALAQAEADLANAGNAARRVHQLVKQNFLAAQTVEDADARVTMAHAGVDQVRARLQRARTHAGTEGADSPAVLASRAALAQARLDLSHTVIKATQSGWLARFTLVPGTLVTAQAPLFAQIVKDSFWVDANFKENELPGIKPGQSVDIALDILPGQILHGVVDTLSSGTGAAFSLLPAQNATGNWVKVVQRVPVRIRLQNNADLQPLCVGASAAVSIHLQG